MRQQLNADGTSQTSFTDANGNGRLDKNERVTSIDYGTQNADGTFTAEYTRTPSGIHSDAGFEFSFVDPKTGDTYSSASGAKIRELARAQGVAQVTILDKKSGKEYSVDADSGKLITGREKKTSGLSAAQQAEAKQDAVDPCSVSARIGHEHDKNFRCGGTQGLAKATDVTNQVLTGAGRTVVNTLGASAAQGAQNGTSASSQDAAAKMAKTSFTFETVLGALNLAATAKHAANANKHKNAVGDLKTWKENEAAESVSGDMIKDTTGSIAKMNEGKTGQRAYEEAIKEQNGARNLAAAAAYKTAMVGMQSITAAIVAKKTQKDSERNARLARKNDKFISDHAWTFDPNQLAPPNPNPTFDPNAAAATAGTESNSSDDAANPKEPEGPMLGDGNDLGGGNDSLDGPKAAAFKSGTSGGAPGGAGGGAPAGGGGGSSAPGGAGAQDEGKAAYASEFSAKERYESAGAAPGGKSGAKGKDDGGIDLNGLLAQFLPKGEEDMGSKNGILDSVAFGGNRNLAAEEAPSYLDKNADLFQRIHETMSEKNRRGQVGI